jgi:hypothetical protein
MALIAELFFDGNKLQAAIVFCTDDEFKNYMNNGDAHDIINSNRISSTYFKEYLKNRRHHEKTLIEKNEKLAQSAVNEEGLVQWKYAPTLTVKFVKQILISCNLDQNEFFDAHCEYLKSL